MGCVIQGHGACPTLCINFFHKGKLGGRVLVGDGKRAVAAGSECIPSSRVEPVGVNALADRHGADDFAGVAVHKGHELVVAAHDEDFMISIDGKAGRRASL